LFKSWVLSLGIRDGFQHIWLVIFTSPAQVAHFTTFSFADCPILLIAAKKLLVLPPDMQRVSSAATIDVYFGRVPIK